MARSRAVAGVVALAGLLVASSSPAWADKPAERAALRQQTEQRIANVEKRLEKVEASDLRTRVNLRIAGRYADLAQKSLSRNAMRSATQFTDSAERFLAAAEGKSPLLSSLKEPLGLKEVQQ